MVFNGLCHLDKIERKTFLDSGEEIENYLLSLKILDTNSVDIKWLHSRALSQDIDELDTLAPKEWLKR